MAGRELLCAMVQAAIDDARGKTYWCTNYHQRGKSAKRLEVRDNARLWLRGDDCARIMQGLGIDHADAIEALRAQGVLGDDA